MISVEQAIDILVKTAIESGIEPFDTFSQWSAYFTDKRIKTMCGLPIAKCRESRLSVYRNDKPHMKAPVQTAHVWNGQGFTCFVAKHHNYSSVRDAAEARILVERFHVELSEGVLASHEGIELEVVPMEEKDAAYYAERTHSIAVLNECRKIAESFGLEATCDFAEFPMSENRTDETYYFIRDGKKSLATTSVYVGLRHNAVCVEAKVSSGSSGTPEDFDRMAEEAKAVSSVLKAVRLLLVAEGYGIAD